MGRSTYKWTSWSMMVSEPVRVEVGTALWGLGETGEEEEEEEEEGEERIPPNHDAHKYYRADRSFPPSLSPGAFMLLRR
jgi:hypothetical protein